ncbi:MAG TPA: 5'/3'-nucleotidase SurE [Acidimicrobiales bacterium]
MTRRAVRAAALVLATTLAVAGCGGDGGDGPPDRGSGGTSTTAAVELDILVTNDDGIDAEGLDVLVEALDGVDGVSVTVVAPADQRSATGDRTVDGDVSHRRAATAGGHDAVAVDGYPTDVVDLALGELGHEPDLVVAGINDLQNLGPFVDVSGTVAAARAAARTGIPALAVSQGRAEEPDFDAAVELVLAWLDRHRADLAAGEVDANVVYSLNVPTCPTGAPRGTVEVAPAAEGDAFAEPECTSTAEGFTRDIPAFMNGYATWSELPLEPASEG